MGLFPRCRPFTKENKPCKRKYISSNTRSSASSGRYRTCFRPSRLPYAGPGTPGGPTSNSFPMDIVPGIPAAAAVRFTLPVGTDMRRKPLLSCRYARSLFENGNSSATQKEERNIIFPHGLFSNKRHDLYADPNQGRLFLFPIGT